MCFKNTKSVLFFAMMVIILSSSCNRSAFYDVQAQSLPSIDEISFQRNMGILTPQQFGARGDGRTNDHASFQAMFDYLESTDRPYNIAVPPKEYLIADVISIPVKIKNECLYINGNGAKLISQGNYPILEKKALQHSDINHYRIIIDGLTFQGDGTGIGLVLRATYSAQITNCHFINLGTGLKSLFSLNGLYQNLRFTNCSDLSFFGGYGDWTGADNTNSAFNANMLQNIRVFGKKGQEAHFKIVAGDNNILSNCISEGVSPRYNVLIDSDNSSVVNHFISVYNFWIESHSKNNQSGSTFFEFRNFRGLARLTDVQAYPRIQKDTLINNPQSNSESQIIIDGYRGNSTLINNALGSVYGTYYIVKNSQPSPLNTNSYLDSKNWVGNKLPIGLIVENYRSQNTGHMQISDHRSRIEKN